MNALTIEAAIAVAALAAPAQGLTVPLDGNALVPPGMNIPGRSSNGDPVTLSRSVPEPRSADHVAVLAALLDGLGAAVRAVARARSWRPRRGGHPLGRLPGHRPGLDSGVARER